MSGSLSLDPPTDSDSLVERPSTAEQECKIEAISCHFLFACCAPWHVHATVQWSIASAPAPARRAACQQLQPYPMSPYRLSRQLIAAHWHADLPASARLYRRWSSYKNRTDVGGTNGDRGVLSASRLVDDGEWPQERRASSLTWHRHLICDTPR